MVDVSNSVQFDSMLGKATLGQDAFQQMVEGFSLRLQDLQHIALLRADGELRAQVSSCYIQTATARCGSQAPLATFSRTTWPPFR